VEMDDALDLRDYLRVISARRWLIVRVVVVVTIAAVAFSLLQAPVYEGQAKVLISEKDTGSAILGTAVSELSGQPERSLQTQVELMQLRPLAENTIRKLGLKQTPRAAAQKRRGRRSGADRTCSGTSKLPQPRADPRPWPHSRANIHQPRTHYGEG